MGGRRQMKGQIAIPLPPEMLRRSLQWQAQHEMRAEMRAECDEVRPGNYVYFDATQAALRSCRLEDVAVSVLTTVVGSYPDRGTLVVDAGALALSKDLGVNGDSRYGIVCDEHLRPLPMKLISVSQEHGKIETSAHLPVGTRLRIVPNHSCLTAAMFDVYHVIDGERVVAGWRPVRGW